MTYSGRFAARLRELRENQKMSVEELSNRLGVSDQAIYCWEAGTRQPKIADLPKIAEVLSVEKVKDILPDE